MKTFFKLEARRSYQYLLFAGSTVDSIVSFNNIRIKKLFFSFNRNLVFLVYLTVPAPVSSILLSFKLGNTDTKREWRIKISMFSCLENSLLGLLSKIISTAVIYVVLILN